MFEKWIRETYHTSLHSRKSAGISETAHESQIDERQRGRKTETTTESMTLLYWFLSFNVLRCQRHNVTVSYTQLDINGHCLFIQSGEISREGMIFQREFLYSCSDFFAAVCIRIRLFVVANRNVCMFPLPWHLSRRDKVGRKTVSNRLRYCVIMRCRMPWQMSNAI